MGTPLFTIVIPFYNPGKLILNCINSINNLHYNNFEVIFVDDGTSDFKEDIHDIIKNKSKFDYNLLVQDNAGVGKARNLGFEHSNGKWVIFIDCDDSISPQLLETYERIIENNKDTKIIFTDFSFVNDDNIQNYDTTNVDEVHIETFTQKGILKAFLKRKRVLLAPGTAFNSEFLRTNNLRFDSIRWSEDQLFVWNCLFKCEKVCHICTPMYNYLTELGTSIMSATSIEKMIDSYPYFIDIAKKSTFLFTKRFLAERWLFGTMHTVIVRKDFSGFSAIYKHCHGRKAMNRLILFGDFKIFLLSLINFAFGHKALYDVIIKVEKK